MEYRDYLEKKISALKLNILFAEQEFFNIILKAIIALQLLGKLCYHNILNNKDY